MIKKHILLAATFTCALLPTALHAQEAATPTPTPTPTPRVHLVPPAPADYTGAPFGGKAQTIPGRIELENFDEGGSGVAWYDREVGNKGGGYRFEDGVDLKGMILPAGRKAWYQSNQGTPTVGWMFVGEWMHYSVDVTPGTYDISVRYGTPIDDKLVDIYLNGEKLSSVATPSTGEYNVWGTVTVKGVKIDADGRALLRVEAAGQDKDENDLDWIEFSKSES